MVRKVEIIARAHPKTSEQQLEACRVFLKTVWIHGAKFSADECGALAQTAKLAKFETALDIVQPLRIDGMNNPQKFNDYESGFDVHKNPRLSLVPDLQVISSSSDLQIAKLNWWPNFGTEEQVVFGDLEGDHAVGQINKRLSNFSKGPILVKVIESSNGRIYSDEKVAGRSTDLNIGKSNLFIQKDADLLNQTGASKVDLLVVSFVRGTEDFMTAKGLVKQHWPGWAAAAGHEIIWKIETMEAIARLDQFASLRNSRIMLGLGDLRSAFNYQSPNSTNKEFDDFVDEKLSQLDQFGCKVYIASGLADEMVANIDQGVIKDMPDSAKFRIAELLQHTSVFGLGLTAEAVKASTKGLLPKLVEKFYTSVNNL